MSPGCPSSLVPSCHMHLYGVLISGNSWTWGNYLFLITVNLNRSSSLDLDLSFYHIADCVTVHGVG